MGERRRYVASDLPHARHRLRADLESLAAEGLRPTWMVWVAGRPAWFRRARGELIVHFDRIATRAGETPWRGLLLPLIGKLEALLRAQEEVSRQVAALPHGGGDARDRRVAFESRCRELARRTAEIELELRRLQRLGGE